jgi:hypothetical protein
MNNGRDHFQELSLQTLHRDLCPKGWIKTHIRIRQNDADPICFGSEPKTRAMKKKRTEVLLINYSTGSVSQREDT